jgi:hypothetical protein
MSWNFWKKSSKQVEPSKDREEKLPKPKDIPEAVGRCLVVDHGKDPDWVWKLKSVVLQHGEKNRFDVRIFDEIQAGAKGIRVRDYTTLDEYPDLILFEGWYDKKSYQSHMEERPALISKTA